MTFEIQSADETGEITACGISCPECGSPRTRTTDSRSAPNNSTRRRRECRSCKHRITTYESIANGELDIHEPATSLIEAAATEKVRRLIMRLLDSL